MRLEINVPDSTSPDLLARIYAITERLSAEPEFEAEIYLGDQEEDAAIHRMFTPERLVLIDAADAEIDAGDFFTAGQVKEELDRLNSEWIKRHES